MTFSFIVVLVSLKMFILELFKPARKWMPVDNWWERAFLLNAIGWFTVFIYGTSLSTWMTEHRLWSADGLGVTGGAALDYLALSFVNYWWHLLRHKSAFFWRWFHQIHHSPQRIEVLTTFYKHPIEAFVDSLVAAPILYLVVGLSIKAAAGALLLAGLVEIFIGTSVRRIGWVLSFSARKVIAYTIKKVCMPTTTQTFQFGTCCSVLSAILGTGMQNAGWVKKLSLS